MRRGVEERTGVVGSIGQLRGKKGESKIKYGDRLFSRSSPRMRFGDKFPVSADRTDDDATAAKFPTQVFTTTSTLDDFGCPWAFRFLLVQCAHGRDGHVDSVNFNHYYQAVKENIENTLFSLFIKFHTCIHKDK